jgi:hypothetical protein
MKHIQIVQCLTAVRFGLDPLRASGRGPRDARRIAGLVALSLVGAGVSLAAATPAEAACAPVVVIGVRGTDAPAGTGSGRTYDTGGLGITSGIISDIQREAPGMQSVGLNYPATAVFPTFPESVAQGSNTLRAELEYLATSCPTTGTILIGHSQGAQVIGDVLDSGTTPQLSAAAKQNINSMALLGDSSYRTGEPINSPRSATTGTSLFPRGAGRFASYTRLGYRSAESTTPEVLPIIRSWCYDGDWACQNPALAFDTTSKGLHNNYGNSPTREVAAEFILSWLIDPN